MPFLRAWSLFLGRNLSRRGIRLVHLDVELGNDFLGLIIAQAEPHQVLGDVFQFIRDQAIAGNGLLGICGGLIDHGPFLDNGD